MNKKVLGVVFSLGVVFCSLFLLASCSRENNIGGLDGQYMSKQVVEGETVVEDIEVKAALQTQTDLLQNGEHCSVDPELLTELGVELGQQIRIIRDGSTYALYTISEVREETSPLIIRMGISGRQRLGTTETFTATASTRSVHPYYTKSEAKTHSEYIEILTDNGTQTSCIVIAPHGGYIERYTDEQVDTCVQNAQGMPISSWNCLGYKSGGGAHDRWHITSTDIHESNLPMLDSVINRGFQYAVAFHGFSQNKILIGGNASSEVKQSLKTAIENAIEQAIPVEIAQPGDPYGGFSSDNIVNRLGEQGIQIEQGYTARHDYGDEIAQAVVDVLRNELSE